MQPVGLVNLPQRRNDAVLWVRSQAQTAASLASARDATDFRRETSGMNNTLQTVRRSVKLH